MSKCTKGLEELLVGLIPEEIKGLQLPNVEEVQRWKEILDRRIFFNEDVTPFLLNYSQLI